MTYHNSLLFLILLFVTLICSSNANTFQVGGKDGWTLHPSESYNNWSGRLRFLINDTLHFKYDGGSDSVLVVNKGDYDGCNSNNPIMKLEGGDSTFKLDRSGPFYFISGNKSNCDQGQKLTVVVLTPRNRSPPTTTPPSPSTLPPAPSTSPVTPSPVATPPGPKSPVSPPLGPGSPKLSPSGTPVMTPPAASPGGGSGMPGSPESSPSGTPVMTPPASSPGGGSGSSPASSPGGASGSSPSGAGGGSSPGQAPAGNPTADVNTPPPPSAATLPLSGSIVASFVTTIFALSCLN